MTMDVSFGISKLRHQQQSLLILFVNIVRQIPVEYLLIDRFCSNLVSCLVLPGTLGMESSRPSSVTSSISTDFNMGTSNNNPPIIPTFPHTRPPNCK